MSVAGGGHIKSAAPVTSVAGKTGAVTLAGGDVAPAYGTTNGGAVATASVPGFVLKNGASVILKIDGLIPNGATLNISGTGAAKITWNDSTGLNTQLFGVGDTVVFVATDIMGDFRWRVLSTVTARVVDTALASGAAVVTGTYTGDMAATREINLGFSPSAVLLMTHNGMMYTSSANITYGGLAIRGYSAGTGGTQNYATITLTASGFITYFDTTLNRYTNSSGFAYRYLAFK